MGAMLEPNRVIAKDVKSFTHWCNIRRATLIVWVGEITWPSNRHNSVPCTVKTSRQRSCNQRVSCLQYLGSRAFEPSKRSCPRMLSTVSRGINRMTYLKDTEEDTTILFRRRDVRRKNGQITYGVSNLQKCKFSINTWILGSILIFCCFIATKL